MSDPRAQTRAPRARRAARHWLRHLCSWCLVLLCVACEGQVQICGPGTRLDGNECVPAPTEPVTCGDQTQLVDGVCVPAATDVPVPDGTDAPDVADVDGASDLDHDGSDDGPVDVADTADTEVAGDADVDATELPPTDAADATDATDAADDGPETPSCIPYCVGKSCGDDGCGGSCGACDDPSQPICDEDAGQCIAVCVPACIGKTCGDDGCGGVCGTCNAGATCQSDQCIPDTWACDITWFNAQDACDCDCGAPDPDCENPNAALSGCDAFETCAPDGTCQGVPAAWTCAASAYNALDNCDCDCGAPDPDCQYDLAVIGCPGSAQACQADGTCEPCTPQCDDKVCGDDGCGGLCGMCTTGDATTCFNGDCVNPCSPFAVACLSATCGDDGCGGSCGTCPLGFSCEFGDCIEDEVPPDPASCEGFCGSVAPAGCYCTEGCAEQGLCCADVEAACGCTPNCDGKDCGDDGCGGSCGTCDAATPYCADDFTCTDVCTPDCSITNSLSTKSCGDDGCGGTCGTCAAGASCSPNFACVPDEWVCPSAYYDDGTACDCGCGAVDPDCETQSLVLGCPTTSTACTTEAICDVAFCSDNGDCPNAWCTGAYATGDGGLGGVCAVPDSQGAPPGTPCLFHQECASGACLGEVCRWHCDGDVDCYDGAICRGVLDYPAGVLQVQGVPQVAKVCGAVLGSGATCASQADCTEPGERCGAVIDVATLGPRYVCTVVLPEEVGADCSVFGCADGLICAQGACAQPCPGGAADCIGGTTCTDVVFHEAGTASPSDDPSVPVCLP